MCQEFHQKIYKENVDPIYIGKDESVLTVYHQNKKEDIFDFVE